MSETKTLPDTLRRECHVPGNPTQTGTNFCRWILENLYDLTDDEADEALCGGAHDAGIDAFFERYGVFTIIQTKYSAADHWANITRLVKDGELLEQNRLNPNEQTRLFRLLERLDELKRSDAQPIIRYVYVTAERFSPAVNAKIAGLGSTNLAPLDLDGIADAIQDKIANISPRWENHRVTLSITASFTANGSLVCCVPLVEIVNLAREAGDYLFASNVRNYLKASRINKQMAETLKTRPQQFWFFNNGVTLVCTAYKEISGKLTVTAPQVVNGCQTVSTIRNTAAQVGTSALESGSILVRVIKAPSELKQDITLYTNAQNAVRGKDLYSLQAYQKQIKQRLKDFGYIYEIQRGEAAQMRPQQRKSYLGRDALRYLEPAKWNRQIPAIEAVQAIAATLKLRPEVSYAASESLTPLGQFYDDLFPADTNLDPRFFLFPFLVVLYARKHLGYGRGGSGWRRSAHFLFATAFHLLLALDSGMATDDDFSAGTVNVSADAYEKALGEESRGEQLLSLADKVLDLFFEDGKVEEILATDFDGDGKNMMKRRLLGSKWYPILVRRARGEFERFAKAKSKIP